MTPLHVVAEMQGGMTGAPMLDGLLAAVVAQRMGLPPYEFLEEEPIIEIPIAREPEGRFHLATSPLVRWDQAERRWVNRRFPIEQAQLMAEKAMRRINISAGPCKSYRIPHEVRFAEGDTVEWYAIGDRDAVVELLACVTHLGKRRGVGRGPVRQWSVDVVADPWDGFPLVRDGKPLRPLPLDWPGLVDPDVGVSTLTYPYWLQREAVQCAVP